MPKPFLLKRLLDVLRSKGIFFVSQRGSHAKYRNDSNPVRTVIVPVHGKEIPYGTFRSILRQAGLVEEDVEVDKK